MSIISPKVIVVLPSRYSYFNNRTLTLDEVVKIKYYDDNVSKRMAFDAFDTDDFFGITFYRGVFDKKISVFALPKDLRSGPEYYINEGSHFGLRSIVEEHLKQHPELNLKISEFS
jgi:hypothetical protein